MNKKAPLGAPFFMLKTVFKGPRSQRQYHRCPLRIVRWGVEEVEHAVVAHLCTFKFGILKFFALIHQAIGYTATEDHQCLEIRL